MKPLTIVTDSNTTYGIATNRVGANPRSGRPSSTRNTSRNSRSPGDGKLFIDPEVEDLAEVYSDPRKDLLSPGWKTPRDPMRGYAGHTIGNYREPHELDKAVRIEKIGK